MAGDTSTVADYIAKAPKWARGTLRELRRVIRKAAPKARESISYHMPYYSQNGRLAYFAVFKSHCSFFWLSAKDKKAFAKELALIDVNYFCRLATTILAGPQCGQGCDSPAAG